MSLSNVHVIIIDINYAIRLIWLITYTSYKDLFRLIVQNTYVYSIYVLNIYEFRIKLLIMMILLSPVELDNVVNPISLEPQ